MRDVDATLGPQPETLDWAGMMRAGLHGLGLRPAEFWALTPVELMVMLGRDGAEAVRLSRSGLESLIARYPDRVSSQDGAKPTEQQKD